MVLALVLAVSLQDASARIEEARRLMREQAFARAEAELQRAVELDDSSSRAYYYLGVCRMRLGRPEDAAAPLEHARALSPGVNVAVAYELGSAYLQTGRYQDAARILSEAREVAPDATGIRLQLGWAHYKLLEAEKARAEFLGVVEQEPKNGLAHFYLGLAEAALGNLEAAEHAFRAALDVNGDFADARLGLGRVLSQSGRYEEAIRVLEDVRRRFPDRAPAAENELGLIALGQGRLEAAVRHFEAVVAADPLHRQALYNLWILYRRLGKSDEARIVRERFESIDASRAEERSLARTSSRPPKR